MIGNGTDTFLNRPSGGQLHFREGNAEEVTIVSGGKVGIGTQGPSATLDVIAVDSSAEGIHALGFNQASGSSRDGTSGITATGGASTGLLNHGGSDVDAQGGAGVIGGAGVSAVGGNGAPTCVNCGGDGIDATAGTRSQFPFGSWAGNFTGDVNVTGAIQAGTKDFKIDHPLDPANRYLVHSSVESSEMMDIYTGNVTLDPNGAASVQLPEWFETLNTDFRYQLTAIGAPAPNLHIAQEVANQQFGIAGGAPGMKVCWQVTGVRHDAFAVAHPLTVEVDKPAAERGYYIHPELYGQPEEKQIEWGRHPEQMKRMKARQAKLVQNTKQ
jgi:hypothetical protein